MATRSTGLAVCSGVILGIVAGSLLGTGGAGQLQAGRACHGSDVAQVRLTFGSHGNARLRATSGSIPASVDVVVTWPTKAGVERLGSARRSLTSLARRLSKRALGWTIVTVGGKTPTPSDYGMARQAIQAGAPRARVLAGTSRNCGPSADGASVPGGVSTTTGGGVNVTPGVAPTTPNPPAGSTAPPTPGGGATPTPAGSTRFGLSLGSTLAYLPAATLNRRLDEVAVAGARRIRIDISWATVQFGGVNSFDWSPFDPIVSGARARGITVLGMLAYTPPWATRVDDKGQPGARPADPATYARFAGAAARHFGPLGVHDWEIWNEPNLDSFWKQPDPAAYTALLRAASTELRRADPQVRVITGGMAPASDGSGSVAPITFLKGIYAAGGGSAFDAVGHHPYTYPARPSGTHPLNAWFQMSGGSQSLRSVMQGAGDGAKQIWMTEFGAPTGGEASRRVSEAEQAAQIREGLPLAGSLPWAGPIFVYELRDRDGNPASAESFFGLVRTDSSLKPAFGAFQEAVRTVGP